MIKRAVFLCLAVLPVFIHAQDLTNATNITITKTWSQEPSGYTYPMSISVPNEAVPEGGFPVCILLHGNGGNGEGTLLQFGNVLDCHALVAPSGYMNSWNICGENSDAPDVEMVTDLILQLQTYNNINPNKIRILGSSNGAALANRVYIENTNPGVDIICAIVSQLSEVQYHDNGFYSPSGETNDANPHCGYDVPNTPITGRKYLSICNENDGVIPYTGGISPVGVSFLDAQEAAYIIAQHEGYLGNQLPEAGTQIGTSTVYEYSYLAGQVVHLKGDAGHGMNDTQREYIKDYFGSCVDVPPVFGCTDPQATNYDPTATQDDGSCTYTSNGDLTNNTDIDITKTWSQETSGWTYPMDIHVSDQAVPMDGFPVCILLHDNGGNGLNMLTEWSTELDCHALIAPSGYLNSWNIADEASEAPDVDMLTDLINQLQTYDNINPNKIRILGVGNGSALANRALIENTDAGVDIICGIVSQLFRGQFHAGNYYKPSGETGGTDFFDGYDVVTTPVMGRKYLGICNENDPIIPYDGGAAVGVDFWTAPISTHIIAESQGFTGPLMNGEGTQIGASTVYEYSYLSGQVVLLRSDAEHDINDTHLTYINDFFATDCEAALATDLSNFTVQEKDCAAHLEWQTTSELQQNYFEIAKSTDAQNFQIIANIPAKNQLTNAQPYSFTDHQLQANNYYRITAVSTNGKRRTSSIIRLEASCLQSTKALHIFPNPATDWVELDLDEATDWQTIQLFNIAGQIVTTIDYSNNSRVALSALPSGVYFLKVLAKGTIAQGKIVKR